MFCLLVLVLINNSAARLNNEIEARQKKHTGEVHPAGEWLGAHAEIQTRREQWERVKLEEKCVCCRRNWWKIKMMSSSSGDDTQRSISRPNDEQLCFNNNNNEMRMGEVHAVKINLPLLFYYSTPGGGDFSEKRATRR
jgi:hypothetical protein